MYDTQTRVQEPAAGIPSPGKPPIDVSKDPLFKLLVVAMVLVFFTVVLTLATDSLLDRSLKENRKTAAAVPTSAPAAPAPTTAAPAAPVSAVTVAEGEMYLRPTATRLAAGVIAFVVHNEGTMHHEFVVVVGDPTGTVGEESGRVSEAQHIGGDNGPEIGDIAPGQTKVLTVKLAPGTYTAMCNLPGHFASGMHFMFTVV
jgi:uncharacterized cupredoxin-like copper-binding protein